MKISDYIPTDLIKEIFLRLPTKSIARFRCLSKLWQHGNWIFFSSPQHQYNKSSLVAATDFHIKFSGDISRYICSHASGLLYFQGMNISKDGDDEVRVPMICNPITGRYAILPKLRSNKEQISFLGFDPIDKQFKVLFISHPYYCDDDYKILTLGTGKMRSEKFKFVDAKFCGSSPSDIILVNYKGKLGGIVLKHVSFCGFSLELCMWVLEDVEKHEWSKCVYYLWDDNEVIHVSYYLSVAGMTTTAEIVLSTDYAFKPYYVYYFNPEKNILRRVEIQGFEEYVDVFKIRGKVFAFVNYVDDLYLNDTKQFKSSLLHQGLFNYHSEKGQYQSVLFHQ
ncbi:putative F-box protein At1g33010 [Capsella rubella]|uniref:putative F-box protein At1g33010 n=1 Tax=Capsella rubella TaxID=81985 RepID=UPI000CD59946|nr:putative F-box protein At1g33010 [Capsella rubella]